MKGDLDYAKKKNNGKRVTESLKIGRDYELMTLSGLSGMSFEISGFGNDYEFSVKVKNVSLLERKSISRR